VTTLFALAALLSTQDAPKPVELRDGDRIVLLGNAFVERDLLHNRLELRLTAREPSRSLGFRNLGWSGDTVWGHARAGFGGPADGFKHLERHVDELKPTLLLLAYGMNEAWDGPKGLDGFRSGFERLLDSVSRGGARIAVLSPVAHERLGPPLPDPAEHNRNLRLYSDAMREIARRRGLLFVDLLGLAGTKERPLTENGIHLNAEGYRRAAEAIERGLGLEPRAEAVAIGPEGRTTFTPRTLPVAPRTVTAAGLAPGRWTLKSGAAVLASAAAEAWAKGVEVAGGPDFDQAEELRSAISAKNFQYFNRWRPQNETYIFGFRKKEQGHLAPEIPQFDPIIAEMEARIAKLRAPGSVTYVLEREK
jgi:lysophospholipase L1-like esterase